MIQIEVAYAKPYQQKIITLTVREGLCAQEAVARSGMVAFFPELAEQTLELGIFGKPCPPDYVLQDGDRVEIYRPLLCDPKEMRRQRAGRRT